MVGFKNGYMRKNLIQNGELQRYTWGTQKKEEEEEEEENEERKRVATWVPILKSLV